ncbi:MAG: DUF262 domain-containing HNH endonuclease family protein [Acidobacteriia bacterium]|nr:DUF262 domain-containing HNH endonuclease family protein [Terriglobia bacterium]
MQIQPQFQTVGVLLTERLFQIPEYQRAYSWQSKQRKDLFEDIQKVAESENDSTHFMATIVGLRRKKLSIASDAFVEIEVVDGQQRLTTLTILLKALSKALRPTDAKRANEIDALLVKGDDLSLLLLRTNHDTSQIFVDYLREGASPKEKTPQTSADHNLVDAIVECEEFVAQWTAASKHPLIELYSIIKNRLSVIFHEIEDEALVYTVFEVLNSRGLDVTWFDKLKSLLMAIVFEHGDSGSKKGTVAELHKLWTEIYGVIGLNWQTLNRETVRFAGTLRAMKAPNRPLGEEDAVKVLIEGAGRSPKKVVDCTKWLLKVTEAEARLLANHRLRAATQIVQARLLAIAVLLRNFSAADEKAILRRWESVTFRIYGLAGRDARTKVGDYVRLAWIVLKENLSPNAILEGVSEIGKDFPVETVVEGLRNRDCYQGWTERLRYFFFRYEEYLAANAGQKVNETQWNRIWAGEPSRSIEHVYPQSRGSADPSTSGIFVHRLGNLAMLPPGVNSKLQDDKPKDKITAYSTCGLLLTAGVGKLLKTGKWDRQAIEKREKQLIAWATNEWQD